MNIYTKNVYLRIKVSSPDKSAKVKESDGNQTERFQTKKQEVLKNALVGYMRVLRKAQNGETKRNRVGAMMSMSRRYKKLCGQTDWYRDPMEEMETSCDPVQMKQLNWQKRDSRRIESVLFVPLTSNSTLMKTPNEQESISMYRSIFRG